MCKYKQYLTKKIILREKNTECYKERSSDDTDYNNSDKEERTLITNVLYIKKVKDELHGNTIPDLTREGSLSIQL